MRDRGIIVRTKQDRATAQAKLGQYIDGARARSGPALARVMNEVPRDQIIRAQAVRFDVQGKGVAWRAANLPEHGIHSNAMTQIADKTGIPMGYVRHLQDVDADWARTLLASTLTEHFSHMPAETRFLTRSIGGETRALLSDKFRPIDCRPGLDALVSIAQDRGAVIADATATDTRVSVKMILPTVHEITEGEFVVVGLAWDNSDFGRGAQTLRVFVIRLWCLNGATLETALREVHLGGRLSDDVNYSSRTRDLDARATISAIRDTAAALLGDGKVRETTALLTAAASTNLDPKTKIADLRKAIGKGLADQVAEAYNRPDVEDLPPGNTVWRWSNALSWVAGHTDDPETRIDLERLAGAALQSAAPPAKRAA